MATFRDKKTKTGKIRHSAQVRIRPFKPTSKTFSTQAEAKAWAKGLEQELNRQNKRGAVSADLTCMTIGELIQQFLDDRETKKLRYHDTLSILLAWWVNHCGSTKVLELNVMTLREARKKLETSGKISYVVQVLIEPFEPVSETFSKRADAEARVKEWKAELRHQKKEGEISIAPKGRAPATVNRYLSALRSCWNWGRAMSLVPQDHTWPTRLLLKEDNERQRYLSDDELKRLIEAAEKHSPTMHAAIVVSVGCGLRQGELISLKWSDIDLDGQRITIMRTKTDQPRTVYLPASAVTALRTLKREAVISTKAVFLGQEGAPLNRGTIRIRWLEVRDAAGLRDFRWHDLRHSCASFLAQNGATLLEIASVLGHRSTTVTRRYAHLVQGTAVTGHDVLNEKLRSK
jgi:integrase